MTPVQSGYPQGMWKVLSSCGTRRVRRGQVCAATSSDACPAYIKCALTRQYGYFSKRFGRAWQLVGGNRGTNLDVVKDRNRRSSCERFPQSVWKSLSKASSAKVTREDPPSLTAQDIDCRKTVWGEYPQGVPWLT